MPGLWAATTRKRRRGDEAQGPRRRKRLGTGLARLVAAGVLTLAATAPAAAQEGYTLAFTPAEPVVPPQGGELIVEVTLQGCSAPTGTVVWDVAADSGPEPSTLPGVDFAPPSPARLTLGAGSPEQTLWLPILESSEEEPGGWVTITLTAQGDTSLECAEGLRGHEGGGIAELEVWIAEEEVPEDLPVLSVADTRVPEGDVGTTDATFTLSLSRPSRREVRVEVATADGSAIAEEDYLPFAGTVRFPPGVTERTVRVPVLGNLVEDGNRTFLLELAEPVGAQLGVAAGEALILDDDRPRDVVLEQIGDPSREVTRGELLDLQVRARTRGGQPIANLAVSWLPSGQVELLHGESTLTDAAGVASQRLRAAGSPGIFGVVARTAGGAEVLFTIAVGDPVSGS